LQVAAGSLATESAKALAAVMKSKVVKNELGEKRWLREENKAIIALVPRSSNN